MKKTMQRERKHCLDKMRNCDGLGLVKKQTMNKKAGGIIETNKNINETIPFHISHSR